jgi:S-DNA-T family DNA segregation ATPase FtsK/SpoIIIE
VASKGRGKSKAPPVGKGFDFEALGLVLLAFGIFILAILIPALPTGALGRTLRETFIGRVGWGAFWLPGPPLVLGGLFLLRRVPASWPRVLLGYMVIGFGLWSMTLLALPELTGQWGRTLRTTLDGAAGVLGYALAVFIVTLGIEIVLAWQPTRITRTWLRQVMHGVRIGYTSFMQARKRMKAHAAFTADVALAKKALKEIDRDLEALSTLYPGSVELDRWRKAVAGSRARLKHADEDTLHDVEADTKAWKQAVADFTKDRANELRLLLKSEGIDEFDGWIKGLKAQLDDPINDAVRIAKPLDDIRKTLALDLTALIERYRRLTRERDLAESTLKGINARALTRAFERHHVRLVQYKEVRVTGESIEAEADRLEPWRDLSKRLTRLAGEFPHGEELNDYIDTLAGELKAKGREALTQIEGWQQALTAVEFRLRHPPAPPSDILRVNDTHDEAAYEDAFTEDETDETTVFAAHATPEAESDHAPFDADWPPVDVAHAMHDEHDDAEAGEELPEVGGIPIQLPPSDLLDARAVQDDDPAARAREVQERVQKIDETLSNFKLQGRVVASVRGPTVTRFEVEPAPGEKISRFANLSDDLALAMAVGSVRIEAPIPGKSVIGLEVPNAQRDLISFREAAESATFRRGKPRLPIILGKSIDGEMVIGDLARMPHLLIAGSTGSGKSVAVNTLVGSLLYKYLPTELRFLMIDPKMVELTPYDGIPHLLRPVVTNPNDAAGVLLGAVAHMERRYKMMSKIGAKNLDQYNQKARNLDMPEMPFIIIIIDELADLMITSPKEVESAIMRLAQMARATGMHLILATQRPSVDILTSLIKVNVPARVAFAVSSGHDSRTILDTMGAERLTGQGDMLFYQPGLVKPMRLQGPYISENEIQNLTGFLKRQFFDDDFVEAYGADFDPPPSDDSSATGMVDWNDDKLREAAELVINEGQGSVSRFQRRLGVGHARAGKLMDSLEALGVVGPHMGSKPREVLVTLDELPNIFGK